MLAHRLRRWPNIVPTLLERFVFDRIYILPLIIAMIRCGRTEHLCKHIKLYLDESSV